MSRVYVAPLAGRAARSQLEDCDPWSTTSRSQLRNFDSTESQNCRSHPVHLRPCLESATDPYLAGKEPSVVLSRSRQIFSGRSRSAGSSAVTVPRSACSRESQASRRSTVVERMPPLPEKKLFTSVSTYTHDQARAQEARRDHFPYRDEFAPRSKRLLYEMALAKVNADDARSATTAADSVDSVSCFTVGSSALTGRSSINGRLSSSAPNILTLPSDAGGSPSRSQLRTGDSRRVPGGVARRRKELNLRAPTQWDPDSAWVSEKWQTDGPAGLASANCGPRIGDPTLRSYGESINVVHDMLSHMDATPGQ